MATDSLPTGQENLKTPIDEASLGIVDSSESDMHGTHLADAVNTAPDMVTSADAITDEHIQDLDPARANYVERDLAPKQGILRRALGSTAGKVGLGVGGTILALGAYNVATGGDDESKQSVNNPGTSSVEPAVIEQPTATPTIDIAPTPEPTPTPEVPVTGDTVSAEFLPTYLAEGEYIVLPNSGTPQELATAYCQAISSAITSGRPDALQPLYGDPNNPVLTQGDMYAMNVYYESMAIAKEAGIASGLGYSMVCEVTRAEEADAWGGGKELTLTLNARGWLTYDDGSTTGIILDGSGVIDRTITLEPNIDVLLPNGEHKTGMVVTRGTLQ